MKRVLPQKVLFFATLLVLFDSAYTGETLTSFQKEINQLIDSCKVSVVTVSARFSRQASVEKETSLFSFFKSEESKTAITSVNVGTGIVFDPQGNILTRSSIVFGAESTTVTFVDGRELAARFIGNDPESGFAVIKIDDENLKLTRQAQSDQVSPGEWILVIGNSIGAFPSVTMGALNGIRSDGLFQITANLNLGNNGSPVFNLKGEIVGLIAGRLSPPYLMPDVLMGDTQYELFVAYPISWIEKVGNDIVQVGQVRRGWIGVIGSHGNNGLTVTRIKDNSPGQQAGLTVGDVIVKYSSTAVNSVTQLARLVEYTAPGQSVPLEFVRNGQLQTVDILIGEKHHHKTAMPPPENPETMMYFEWPTGSEMVERNQALENRVELLEKELEKVKKLLEAK